MIDLNYFYRTLDKTKQEYSETEGNDYPLFFACKNNDRDVRVGRRGNMETKVKRRLIHLLFAFLLAAGWYLIQYFCAYVVMSGSMEPTIPTGSIVVVDGRKKERKPGDIITYRRGSVVVTHRIVKKREEGYCTCCIRTDRSTDSVSQGEYTAGNTYDSQCISGQADFESVW